MPIKFNLEKYKNRVFVESGTYHGKGCINAIESGFEEIHSMEVHAPILEVAKKNLEPYQNKANINLYVGDSIDTLETVLENIKEPATFWLDGHDQRFDGGGVGKRGCPIYEELDIIAKHHIKEHTIMIDDLRIIRRNSWGTPDVTIDGVMERLKAINPNYKFAYEDGAIEDDCVIAYVE